MPTHAPTSHRALRHLLGGVSLAVLAVGCSEDAGNRPPPGGFTGTVPVMVSSDADAAADGQVDDASTSPPDGDATLGGDADVVPTDAAPTGLQPAIPRLPEGGCPTFEDGLTTFSVDGETRSADVEGTPAGGALVLYWHGTGSNPAETSFGLGRGVIDAIVADGGMVVAPYQALGVAPAPWYAANGYERDDDMRFADVIVACAVEAGIDPTRIHSMGFSAGGLQTTTLSFDRSNWLASAVTYSGGINPYVDVPADAEPNNPMPALIFHGGFLDVVAPYDLRSTSISWWEELDAAGRFALICDHGLSHVIPTTAQDEVWAFFDEHRFGTSPEPWADSWEDRVPEYCDRTP